MSPLSLTSDPVTMTSRVMIQSWSRWSETRLAWTNNQSSPSLFLPPARHPGPFLLHPLNVVTFLSNCTRESRYRSYSGKKSENNLCPHCNVPQDVLHVLIHCDYPAVKRKRESFLSQYCTYARNYTKKSETVQIRELLNIDPQYHEEDKPLAQNIICSFVNHIYNIVNTSLSE